MIKPIKKLTGLKFENAQTMVEFALVFPIVLLITYGIMEFGRMVYIYAAVTGSAREGARYGAASGNLVNPYFRDCSGILNAARRGAILTPVVVDLIWWDSGPATAHLSPYSCFTSPTTPPPVLSIKLGYRIGVHVTAHYSPIIRFLGLSGFDIVSENARTILVNVPIATPGP